MVHNDDVALRRLPPHLRDEAPLVIRTLLPQASLAPRVQLGPHRARLRQAVNLHPVARLRRLFPLRNRLVLADLFQSIQNRLAPQPIQLVPAQVVRPALHVRHPQRPQQRLQKRNVLVEKLLLQVLRPRRDNHPPPAPQRRQQVSQRLARARAGFHNQVPAFLHGPLHRLRHLQLPPPKLVRHLRLRKNAARRKKRVQGGVSRKMGRGIGHGQTELRIPGIPPST